MGNKISRVLRATSFIALLGFVNITQAGQIPDQQVGWNRDNLDTYLYSDEDCTTGESLNNTFVEWNPALAFPSNYLCYLNRIFDSTARTGDNTTPLTGNHMATLVAKNPPVGEMPGIKIINNDSKVKPPKPVNCIISTAYLEVRSDGTGSGYLDSGNPEQVICSSPFQTHKRWKVGMLPAMVATPDGTTRFGDGVDLVFNVTDGGETQYQVFQKINNWTDSRLDGFMIEIGTGVGLGFQEATATSTPLTISVPDTIWKSDQLANFSNGLFGPVDPVKFPLGGYFDNQKSAGFEIVEYATQTFSDTLTAITALTSNYPATPPTVPTDKGQFGNWLPNKWLPEGIFHDVDHDPDTDDDLVAWWGYNPALTKYSWMTGVLGGFTEVPQSTVDGWAVDPWYHMGDIDDLVNIGLNYIVTIGDTYDAGTFTIRITPRKSADQTEPGFEDNKPPPFNPVSEGEVVISPKPTFSKGETLLITVRDSDLAGDETVEVTVRTDFLETEKVILDEIGGDRGLFQGFLPTIAGTGAGLDGDGEITVDNLTIVTVEYDDLNFGDAGTKTVEDMTQAVCDVNFYVIPLPNGAVVFPLGN